MKDNTKITLTVKQLKELVNESQNTKQRFSENIDANEKNWMFGKFGETFSQYTIARKTVNETVSELKKLNNQIFSANTRVEYKYKDKDRVGTIYAAIFYDDAYTDQYGNRMSKNLFEITITPDDAKNTRHRFKINSVQDLKDLDLGFIE